MKLYHLQRPQLIPRPRREVFEFFSKPENLALLTPRDLGFSILTPSPISMSNGALIDYTIRVLGVNVRWTTLVTEYQPPHKFVDVQLRGPYSFWHHTHEFSEAGGGTEMTDTVCYGMSAGVPGRIVHALFVRNQLEKIFDYREKRVNEMFPEENGFATSAQKRKTRRRTT